MVANQSLLRMPLRGTTEFHTLGCKGEFMKFKVFLIAFLIIFSSLHLKAESKLFKGGIDPSIWRVVGGGLWEKNDDDYGNYRVVVQNLGWEHTRSYLYLQWLKTDDAKEEVVELKTISIPEFNDTNWLNVREVTYGDNAFDISYIVRGEEEKVRKAELRPALPGKYKFVFK